MQLIRRKATICTSLYRNVNLRYFSFPPDFDFSNPQVQNMMKTMLKDPKLIQEVVNKISMNPKYAEILKDPKAMEKMNTILQNPATMKLISDPNFMKSALENFANSNPNFINGAVENYMKSTSSPSPPPSPSPKIIDSKAPSLFDKIGNMFKK